MNDFTLIDYLPGLFVLLVFGIGAALMITKKLPALLTLPLMAFVIMAGMSIYGNMPYYYGISEEPLITAEVAFSGVFGEGAKKLANAMILAFLGGILSFMMQKSGVAEQMVKNGAELIGDNPFAVAIFCMTLVGILFTTIGGLGAIIMVSIVLIPMMATVGIPPIVAGGIIVIGVSMGGCMNAANWVRYTDTMGIPYATVRDFGIVVFIHVFAAGVCFIAVEMWRAGSIRSFSKVVGIIAGTVTVALLLVLGIWILSGGGEKSEVVSETPSWLMAIRFTFGVGFFLLLCIMLFDIYRKIKRWRQQVVQIKWYAYLIPLVPLVFIIVYDLDFTSSFMIGIIYAMIATARPGSISLTVQSMIQGAATVMPAVILFIGIGLIIMVFKGPGDWQETTGTVWPTLQALNPYFAWMKPDLPTFLIFFSLFAPLALYRGPLNTWGLGFGVAVILTDTVLFSAPIIMGMLFMTGQIQSVCDPTNTDNVWISNELRIDVQQLMLRTLPYFWVMAIIGLAATTFFFPVDQKSWQQELRNRAGINATEAPVTLEDLNAGLPDGAEVLDSDAEATNE